MDFEQIFQINTPTVICEIFDDEVVVINMDSGTYYSLEQSSTTLWQWLQQGATLSELIAKTAAMYLMTADEITPALQQFVTEMAEEQLIVAVTTPHPSIAGVFGEAFAHASPASHQRFTPPHLNKFTDMQDLLLLDPIHDVAESGWPYVKSQ